MFSDRDLEPFHYFYSEETLNKRGKDLYKHIRKGTDKLLLSLSLPAIIMSYFGFYGGYTLNGVAVISEGWSNVLIVIIGLVIYRYIAPFIIYMSLGRYLNGYQNND